MPQTSTNDLLAEMAAGLGTVWVMIVADNDGMLLSSWQSPENRLPPEILGGFIQTIQGAITAFQQSTTQFGKIDDVIYSMGFSTILIKPIADGACFIVVDAPKATPVGMIRMAANNYATRIEQSLPGYQSLPRRDGMGTIVP
jgi:predicted regulator of Ras-like GTPase activity (Roadblock/LC7/MglB family)